MFSVIYFFNEVQWTLCWNVKCLKYLIWMRTMLLLELVFIIPPPICRLLKIFRKVVTWHITWLINTTLYLYLKMLRMTNSLFVPNFESAAEVIANKSFSTVKPGRPSVLLSQSWPDPFLSRDLKNHSAFYCSEFPFLPTAREFAIISAVFSHESSILQEEFGFAK